MPEQGGMNPMQQQMGVTGMSPITGGAPGPGAPPEKTGAATTGGDAKGLQDAHKASIQTVIKVREEGISVWGSTSEEGQAIIKALQTLTKGFGTDPASDITKAHVQNLQDVLAGPQGKIPLGGAGGQPQPQGAPGISPQLMQTMGG